MQGTDESGPIGHGWTYSAHPICAAAGAGARAGGHDAEAHLRIRHHRGTLRGYARIYFQGWIFLNTMISNYLRKMDFWQIKNGP